MGGELTMKKYIDLAAAIKAIEAVPQGNWNSTRYANAVKKLPAAHVAPVVHARWTRSVFDGEYYCSKCGKMTADRHDEMREFEGKTVIALALPRYCGFCGAKMDEKEDDNG